MKKRWIAILFAMLLFVGGCADPYPDLTKEQEEQITNYAAGLLLRYDKNYSGNLMSEEEIIAQAQARMSPTPTPTPLPTEAPVEEQEDPISDDLINDGGQGNSNASQKTLVEILGLEGFTIEYQEVYFCNSYPESTDDLYFAFDAIDGYQLMIAKFVVTNISSEPQEIDVMTKELLCRIRINGGSPQQATATYLDDDLRRLKTTMQPMESIEEVIVAEISNEDIEAMQTLSLTMKVGNESTVVQLK